jgi:hypothetical protein
MEWLSSHMGYVHISKRCVWGRHNAVKEIYQIYINVGGFHFCEEIVLENINQLQLLILKGVEALRKKVGE